MTERPTLHEIAAMPYPASVTAMRKYYNPDWGKPVPDGAELRQFRVTVEYSYSIYGLDTVTVEAFTEEEAHEKAADKIADDLPPGIDDFDVLDSDAELLS